MDEGVAAVVVVEVGAAVAVDEGGAAVVVVEVGALSALFALSLHLKSIYLLMNNSYLQDEDSHLVLSQQ